MNTAKVIAELNYKAVRSGGPGGQHANKVASKVQLLFNVASSEGLSDEEKTRIRQKLDNLISGDVILQLASETHRSQHRNKELVTQRFLDLMKEALRKPKKRKATRPSKASIEKRLETKKKASQRKSLRKRPDF